MKLFFELTPKERMASQGERRWSQKVWDALIPQLREFSNPQKLYLDRSGNCHYGLITFHKQEDSTNTLEKWNGRLILGGKLSMRRAQKGDYQRLREAVLIAPKKTTFVHFYVHQSVGVEKFVEHARLYGWCSVYKSRRTPSFTWAIFEYRSRAAAERAVLALHNLESSFGTFQVSFTRSLLDTYEEEQKQQQPLRKPREKAPPEKKPPEKKPKEQKVASPRIYNWWSCKEIARVDDQARALVDAGSMRAKEVLKKPKLWQTGLWQREHGVAIFAKDDQISVEGTKTGVQAVSLHISNLFRSKNDQQAMFLECFETTTPTAKNLKFKACIGRERLPASPVAEHLSPLSFFAHRLF